jgi:hypothetical protein
MNEMRKQVKLSQIREDLNSGLTRWKKDDIGFGSLEKKYNLTMQEMIQLLANPKVASVETRIPTFIIIDDIEDEEVTTQETTANIEVAAPVKPNYQPQQTHLVVKEEKQEEVVAFI